jgi:hypothetical protein
MQQAYNTPSQSGPDTTAVIEIARMMLESTERDRDYERSDRNHARLDAERERHQARLDVQQMQKMMQHCHEEMERSWDKQREDMERLRNELTPRPAVGPPAAPTFWAVAWRWLPRVVIIALFMREGLRSRSFYALLRRVFGNGVSAASKLN